MNIIITGASKGIGLAIAQKLVAQNIHVAFCSRTQKDVFAAAKNLRDINSNVKIYHAQADLSKAQDCQKFIQDAQKDLGPIDVLINNAGSYLGGSIHSEADGQLQKMMETNLYSAYNCTRAVLPQMMQNKRGHIINICSIAGLQAYPNGGSYSISKFAMVGFSKNLRQEMMPHNIKVTTVSPGATMSDSWAGSNIEPTRIMEANDIAETIWAVINLAPQSVVEDIVLRPILGDL